jgi:hypothetical protein
MSFIRRPSLFHSFTFNPYPLAQMSFNSADIICDQLKLWFRGLTLNATVIYPTWAYPTDTLC